MIKKFENFFNNLFKADQGSDFKDEMRVVLNDEDFSDLCETGHVSVLSFNVPITQIEFDRLIDGDVIDVYQGGRKFIIALSDIGYDRIFMHMKGSQFFK